MIVISFDTETARFRPGKMAPELACLTWQLHDGLGAFPPMIRHHSEAEPIVRAWLEDPNTRLVGQNVAYDMAVLGANFPDLIPLIFQAYEDNRVTDTMIRQQLLDIAAGCYRGKFGENNKWIKISYDLQSLAKRHLGIYIEKDTWRTHYGELRDVPLADWPKQAEVIKARELARLGEELEQDLHTHARVKLTKERDAWRAADPKGVIEYPLDDARHTLGVYLKQEAHAEKYLEDQFRQTRAAWSLHLMSVWGLKTTAEGVEQLKNETEAELEEVQARLVQMGLVREDGTRDIKAAAAYMLQVCEEKGLQPHMTDKGNVSLDADACKAADDPVLKDYALLTELAAVLNKDVKALEGRDAEGKPCFLAHTRMGMAESGRSTSSGPNIQNWRGRPGIRECFIPRPGFLYAQADYGSLELHTLAQVCIDLFGKSRLAEVLNQGRDAHTDMATQLLGISYDAFNKEDKEHALARKLAKVANFGLPGGMGVATFRKHAASKPYYMDLSVERAQELKAQWLANWPEMHEYFAYISSCCRDYNGRSYATIKQLRSNRIRAGATYAAACNSLFQGLGGDATKHAGWLIAKACYTERNSPLFGSRMVAYVHDEFICEVPIDRAHDAANELARLMVVGANVWLPDVPVRTSAPALMKCWSKKAEAVYDDNGRLIPWQEAA